jgi:hypothetical protein
MISIRSAHHSVSGRKISVRSAHHSVLDRKISVWRVNHSALNRKISVRSVNFSVPSRNVSVLNRMISIWSVNHSALSRMMPVKRVHLFVPGRMIGVQRADGAVLNRMIEYRSGPIGALGRGGGLHTEVRRWGCRVGRGGRGGLRLCGVREKASGEADKMLVGRCKRSISSIA